MNFRLQYHEMVAKEDIPRLSFSVATRVRKAIEEKLTTDPLLFGKPLRRSMKNFRSLRVGDYRVIFRIESSTVKIFLIQHRSVVYQHAKKRIL